MRVGFEKTWSGQKAVQAEEEPGDAMIRKRAPDRIQGQRQEQDNREGNRVYVEERQEERTG